MGLNRREMVMAALSAGVGTVVLGGCSTSPGQRHTTRPVAPAAYPARPTGTQQYNVVRPTNNRQHVTVVQPGGQQPQATAVTPALAAIGRSDWTGKGPVKSKVNPMRGISKITIHHEGWNAVWFSDKKTTAQRIEKIRRYHVEDKRWGDIGYHYIVDRAGRVWEGRPIQYQGAHVSKNNEHNIGILVLGNFEKQSPSSAQLKALYAATASLSKHHRVKTSLVRSHKEINPTTCPGKNLQRQMNALRKHVG